LVIDWNATTATASLTGGGTTTRTILAFGNPTADATNPGFNGSVVPPSPVSLTRASESIQLVGGAFCLQAATVAQLPAVSFVVAAGPGAPSGSGSSTSSSVTSSGDFVLHPGAARYVVLGYPEDPLWVGSVSGGGSLGTVGGAPFANVYLLSATGNGSVVTLHFRTWILIGLDVSFAEVGGLVSLLVVLAIRARWGKRSLPAESRPNTSDAPVPATPPAPPR
jgi:hypothetical protein